MNILSKSELNSIILKIIERQSLSSSEQEILKTFTPHSNYPFTHNQEPDLYREKISILPLIYPSLKKILQQLNFTESENYLTTIWFFWLPLALELANLYRQKSHPIVIGILGSQGTGKTTITKILPLIWQYLNLSSVAISLDDLYKTYQDRKELLKLDSRLIWRGPPGTHDIKLGLDVLTALKNRQYPVNIPRFDKSLHEGRGDRISGEIVNQADIIIFEGWFVGVKPVEEKVFKNPPPPIITKSDRTFAIDCNRRLKEYLPLWEKLNYLMILNPEDYRYSLKWRQEAEQKMIAQGKTGMNNQEIEEFVFYFWKALHPEIFIKPLIENPQSVNLVVNIDIHHQVNQIIKRGRI
ncbi:glycerate kinase [Cyanobacterium aponinum FACHB-4101]|nr:glycerate kinase [Cyanobacterium aponinum]MBD2392962.1 glycerate kinase [Cyanobacterium aponinum FACHB-4101]